MIESVSLCIGLVRCLLFVCCGLCLCVRGMRVHGGFVSSVSSAWVLSLTWHIELLSLVMCRVAPTAGVREPLSQPPLFYNVKYTPVCEGVCVCVCVCVRVCARAVS